MLLWIQNIAILTSFSWHQGLLKNYQTATFLAVTELTIVPNSGPYSCNMKQKFRWKLLRHVWRVILKWLKSLWNIFLIFQTNFNDVKIAFWIVKFNTINFTGLKMWFWPLSNMSAHVKKENGEMRNAPSMKHRRLEIHLYPLFLRAQHNYFHSQSLKILSFLRYVSHYWWQS